jgi:hypothetical protein
MVKYTENRDKYPQLDVNRKRDVKKVVEVCKEIEGGSMLEEFGLGKNNFSRV